MKYIYIYIYIFYSIYPTKILLHFRYFFLFFGKIFLLFFGSPSFKTIETEFDNREYIIKRKKQKEDNTKPNQENQLTSIVHRIFKMHPSVNDVNKKQNIIPIEKEVENEYVIDIHKKKL